MKQSLLRSRRPLSPATRAGIGAAAMLLALVSVAELADGRDPNYGGLIVLAPFLAAAFAGWRVVLAVGTVATLAALAFALGAPTIELQTAVNVAAVALATGIAAAVTTLQQRRGASIAELARTQQAVVRPLGPQVGALAVASRYISATVADPDLGCTFYEALDTPYGARVIIGNVWGRRLDAVRLASIVLALYRHVALERANLGAIVADLDRAVARSVGDEGLVTAVLVEERGGTLTIVNCGHRSPLLLRRGMAIPLDPIATARPLGFMPVVQPRVERLEPADRLLLFTGRARRDGEFFPTAERAWALLGHGQIAGVLASLETALVDWVRGRLEDDIALVLMEYVGASQPERPSAPSWESDTSAQESRRRFATGTRPPPAPETRQGRPA